jgi:hypothetical protein
LPKDEVIQIAARCEIVTRLGWGWASLLNLTRATIAAYSHVFVLVDDVLLPESTFNVASLLGTMQTANVSVLSPAVAGAERTSMSPLQRPLNGASAARHRAWWVDPNATPACVRSANVLELFATAFTARAFECFTSMFADEVLRDGTGAVGWGYDLCFLAHCGHRAGVRQGIAVGHMAIHTEGPLAGLGSVKERALLLLQEYEDLARWPFSPGIWARNASHQARRTRGVLTRLRRELLDAGNVLGGYANEFQIVAETIGPEKGGGAKGDEEGRGWWEDGLGKGERHTAGEGTTMGERDRGGGGWEGRSAAPHSTPYGRRLSLAQHGRDAPGMRQAKALEVWVLRTDGRTCIPSWRRTPGFKHFVQCL